MGHAATGSRVPLLLGLASLAGTWPEQPALTLLHQSCPVQTALRSWWHPQDEPDWNKLSLMHGIVERHPV